MPLIPEAEAGRSLKSGPAWSTEFQDSQSYTEKPCLEKTETNKKKRKETRDGLSVANQLAQGGTGHSSSEDLCVL